MTENRWEIIKDFQGKSHKQGGIEISISNGKIFFNKNNSKIKAEWGMIINSDNPPEVQVGEVEIKASAPTYIKYLQQYESENPFDIESYVKDRFNNPKGRESIYRINRKQWEQKLREEGLDKRKRELDEIVKRGLLYQRFNPQTPDDMAIADEQFRKRYGTSAHQYRYENDAEYRAYYERNAKNSSSKIDYPYTDIRSDGSVAPNNMWMYPNLSGNVKSEMTNFTNEAIGMALPIPGIDAMGKIPGTLKGLSSISSKISDVKQIALDKISDVKVNKLVLDYKSTRFNAEKAGDLNPSLYSEMVNSENRLLSVINSENFLSKKTYENISKELPHISNLNEKMYLNSNHKSVIGDIIKNPDIVPDYRYTDILAKEKTLPYIKISKLDLSRDIPSNIKNELLSNKKYRDSNELKELAINKFPVKDILSSKNININSSDARKIIFRDDVSENDALKLLGKLDTIPSKAIYDKSGRLKFSDKFILKNFLNKEDSFLNIGDYPKNLTMDTDLTHFQYSDIQKEVFEKYKIAPIKIFPTEFTRQLQRDKSDIKGVKDLLEIYNKDLYPIIAERFKGGVNRTEYKEGMGLGIGKNGNWIGLGQFATPKRVADKGYGPLQTIAKFKKDPIIIDAEDAYKLPLKGVKTGTLRGLQYDSVEDALYDSNYLRSLGIDAIRIYEGEIQLYNPNNIKITEIGVFNSKGNKYKKMYEASVKLGIVPIAMFPISNALNNDKKYE